MTPDSLSPASSSKASSPSPTARIVSLKKYEYYSHDGITIYHGDCRQLAKEIVADVVLTDPPYNATNIGPNKRVYIGTPMRLSQDDYSRFCSEWFSAVRADTIVFTPGIANTHCYPQPRWQLCWHKPASVSFNRMGGYNAWEPVFVYGNTQHVRLPQDYLKFNTLNFTKGVEREHPCPKPPALWKYLLATFSEQDDVVLDPFLGSGTTAKVAKYLRRTCIGIEIEERYCELAAKRLAQEVFDFKGNYILY